MSGRKVLAVEFWVMILIQTIGSIDLPRPGKADSGKRKLPAPRYYGAACLLFALLGLMTEVNTRLARVASGIGGTVVLAALLVGVAGPGSRQPGTALGTRTLNFLNRVATTFAPPGAGAGQAGQEGTEPQPPDREEV